MKNKITTVTLKAGSKPQPGRTDFARLDKMSDAELEANALSDEDNLPLTKAELAKFKPVNPVKKIDVKLVREKMNVSQERFASYFGVSVRTLQDWEQHRHEPNSTARNFLLVVSKVPRIVQKILGVPIRTKALHKRVHHTSG